MIQDDRESPDWVGATRLEFSSYFDAPYSEWPWIIDPDPDPDNPLGTHLSLSRGGLIAMMQLEMPIMFDHLFFEHGIFFSMMLRLPYSCSLMYFFMCCLMEHKKMSRR